MAITAVRLQNFRGFADARIELKPLTVLLGPNSAGKSSFGHALAALAYAHSRFRGAGYFDTSLTPRDRGQSAEWPVDLGGLTDLRTSGKKGPVRIEIESAKGMVGWGFGLKGEDALLLSELTYPSFTTVATPVSYAGGSHYPVGAATSAAGRPLFKNIQADTLNRGLRLTRINRQQWRDDAQREVRVDMDGLLIRGVQHSTGTSLPFESLLKTEVGQALASLCYLRAVRERPLRAYSRSKADRQTIGYGGEGTATILLERLSAAVKSVFPPPIPESVKAAKQVMADGPVETRATLGAAVGKWLSHLGLLKSVVASEYPNDSQTLRLTARLHDQKAHDITEVGLGISQVLPVLVAGLLQPRKSLFVVDLPEAHLHPRPQAELADFFCSMALLGRSALVETHSEAFFHRLRLRCELHPELRDLVSVYFIDAPTAGSCCLPRRVGLSLADQTQWPIGFMEEALDNERALTAAREARKHRHG